MAHLTLERTSTGVSTGDQRLRARAFQLGLSDYEWRVLDSKLWAAVVRNYGRIRQDLNDPIVKVLQALGDALEVK